MAPFLIWCRCCRNAHRHACSHLPRMHFRMNTHKPCIAMPSRLPWRCIRALHACNLEVYYRPYAPSSCFGLGLLDAHYRKAPLRLSRHRLTVLILLQFESAAVVRPHLATFSAVLGTIFLCAGQQRRFPLGCHVVLQDSALTLRLCFVCTRDRRLLTHKSFMRFGCYRFLPCATASTTT